MTTDIDTLEHFGERTQAIFKKAGCMPTPAQVPILNCDDNYIMVSGGIQAGKSIVSSQKLVKEFTNDLRKAVDNNWPMPLVYWLVGQDYAGTEREFFYLQDYFKNLGWLRRWNKKLDPGQFEIIGGPRENPVLAIVRTKSARDFRTLRMESPSGIIGCEASQIDLIAFDRMKERTVPRDGWLFLAGTMEGGWYPKLHQEWSVGEGGKRSFSLPTHSNQYLFPEGEEDQRIKDYKAESTDDYFMERFMGIPCPPQGIVFPEFRPDFHVRKLEYDENYPVQLWEDPGYSAESAHALYAVQIIDGQVRLIDEVYERRKTTEVIIEDIVKKRPWWKAHIEVLVTDPHYAVQHHGTSSVEEIWKRLTGLRVYTKRERVMPRLERIRTFLKADSTTGAPQLVINTNCQGILSEFGCAPHPFNPHLECVYRWRLDRSNQPIGDEPEDANNHGIEALGRGLVYNFSYSSAQRSQKSRMMIFRGNGGRRGRRGQVSGSRY